MRKNIVKKALGKARILSGIYSNRVFQGPYQVYVNLTDHCNLNCLMCSVYSPLVAHKFEGHKRGFLKREVLDKLADSLIALKVSLVTLTGGGEPFLHPNLMHFVKVLSNAQKDVTVVTNGTLIKEGQIQELLERNVNFRFSLIAASPKTYMEVHPNQPTATFEELKNTLAFIRDYRKRSKSRSVVSILFVIFRYNFREIPRMLDMGREYQTDLVHFKPAIFDHEQMKELFLDDAQFKELQNIIGTLKTAPHSLSTNLKTMRYDLEQNQRRLIAQKEQTQKRSIPCFKGWTFCWILATGDVAPCCDCSVSMGNINDQPLENIWYSPQYSELRRGMTSLHKGPITLKSCRCDTCRPDSEDLKIAKGFRLLGKRFIYNKL
jgi:MoaA/NifB/PqqE/SkfB family radical SAM enzyme